MVTETSWIPFSESFCCETDVNTHSHTDSSHTVNFKIPLKLKLFWKHCDIMTCFPITCYFVLGNSDKKKRSESKRRNEKHVVRWDLESLGRIIFQSKSPKTSRQTGFEFYLNSTFSFLRPKLDKSIIPSNQKVTFDWIQDFVTLSLEHFPSDTEFPIVVFNASISCITGSIQLI